MGTSISRRTFLKATGLSLALCVTPFGYRIFSPREAYAEDTFKPNVWIEITPKDEIILTVPNSEMGQGNHTAFAQILADELEADWRKVKVRQAEAGDAYKSPLLGAQITVASASVRGFFEPLRVAGATARVMLIKAAAAKWQVPEGECEADTGKVIHKLTKRSTSYASLTKEAANIPIPKDPPLKRPEQFKYIGKSMERLDIPAKVEGKAIFGMDFKVPNMLYAVIARPPVYGAKLVSFDATEAEKVKGVQKVVKLQDLVAVCANDVYSALKGRDALKVTWGEGTHPNMDDEFIERHFMEGLEKKGAVAKNVGNVKEALGKAKTRYEAVYFVPFVAHALMEPINCTAHVTQERCEVWAPTQSQTISQVVASKVSGLPPEKVHIHTTYLGCGLGRRANADFVAEAVMVSKAVGRPVKVFWTREEDIKYDFFRGATAQKITVGLDENGQVIGWDHKVSCSSILKFLNPAGIKDGVDLYSLWGIVDAPNAPTLNNTPYEFPNFYVEQYLSDLPIPVWPWRSVQNGPNAFIVESFLDEVANLLKKDPIEFRFHLLKNNPRARRVLEVVREKSGWDKPLKEGRGRGVAFHSCFGSYVAHVAEVSVDEKTGVIKVHRVVSAVDCGLAVNPRNIVAQIEGAIVMGLSTTLKEKVSFSKGGVKSSNLDDYPLIRMSEVPDIEVHIVESKDKLGGIGEPGIPPTAPAVANAFFNLTKVRIRRIPLDPSTVKKALSKQ